MTQKSSPERCSHEPWDADGFQKPREAGDGSCPEPPKEPALWGRKASCSSDFRSRGPAENRLVLFYIELVATCHSSLGN